MSSSRGNVVLAGFMGAGKSTVGPILAQSLERAFVDMDEVLEHSFGKPIARVFAEEGEARFRRAEAALAQELATQQGLVIACGGGALVEPRSREALAGSGIIVCLDTDPETAVLRLGSGTARPLARAPDALHTLWRHRQPHYAALPHHVSTTLRTPDETARAIVDLLPIARLIPGLRTLAVRAPGVGYPILASDGILPLVGMILRELKLGPGPAAVVTDENVASIEAAPLLLAGLTEAGFESELIALPPGEGQKQLATMGPIYERLIAARLDRRSPVVAFGGGVVGDIAGFAAATYLRGVPFVQIPTTLLAMVDASVGGKTGVNLPAGKNLVGAFKMPAAVLVDPTLLETLPAPELRAGLGEVVKHALLDDPDLFESLADGLPEDRAAFVLAAVAVKVRVVEADPYERGRRALLNLGHTFAHALEREAGYTGRHGEAVALGLIAAAHLGAAVGACAPQLVDRVAALLERLDLASQVAIPGVTPGDLYRAMAHDKKRSGDLLRFVVPTGVGSATVIDDPGAELVRAALAHILAD